MVTATPGDSDMSGYDSAQKLKKDDDLGRWRFAAEIAEVIRSTPADWSARIGIFGKWGEGKSTVLHFLEEMLKPEGNIVFYFTPWAVQELDELWAEFGTALLKALEAGKLEVELPGKGTIRRFREKVAATGIPGLVQGGMELWGKEKLYKGALGFVSKWLKPDGKQVKKIREKLGNKRVVVLIDDLDRATPELLPKLLLSLREILDLPGFTFVLAFDNEIVADGLITANKAWGDGDNFLDKILDFHYYLPTVSRAAKRLLLNNMLDQHAEFVPLDSIDAVEHLLPDNPRKLKRLVRGLVALQPQLIRHRADELNWVEIWLAEMIRQESFAFFIRLLDGGALESLIGVGYQVRHLDRRIKGKDDQTEDVDIKEVAREVGGINEKQTARLIELIKAARTLGGSHLEYNFKFALRPEAITWKEFDELLTAWKESSTADTIAAWIAHQCSANSIDSLAMETDLFQTLLNAKETATSKASEASTVQENARYCVQALSLLTMTEEFLNLPEMLTPERFGKLYGKSSAWIAFRKNAADGELRDAELALIYSLLDRASEEQAPGMFDTLKPWNPSGYGPEDAQSAALKKQLRSACITRLLPKVERACVAYLHRPESLRVLSTPQSSPAFRYVLFSADRLPWSKEIRNGLLDVMREAKTDENAYDKANEFLDLLVQMARNGTIYLDTQCAERIAKDQDFVSALWQAATSRAIQFRMQNSYLAKRAALIQLGVREALLPLPPELAKAKEESGMVEPELAEDVDDTESDVDIFLDLEDDESLE